MRENYTFTEYYKYNFLLMEYSVNSITLDGKNWC
jgi:hypothetical protein